MSIVTEARKPRALPARTLLAYSCAWPSAGQKKRGRASATTSSASPAAKRALANRQGGNGNSQKAHAAPAPAAAAAATAAAAEPAPASDDDPTHAAVPARAADRADIISPKPAPKASSRRTDSLGLTDEDTELQVNNILADVIAPARGSNHAEPLRPVQSNVRHQKPCA